MKIILALLFVIFEINSAAQHKEFKPDTSISGIKLQDSISIRSIIPDFIKKIDYTGTGAKITLVNKHKTEIATLIFHSGSNADLIAEINLSSFIDSLYNMDKTINVNIDYFTTESKIKLGISKAKLIQIKGQALSIENYDETEILKYRIDNYKTSAFLMRYNYPTYYSIYQFKRNKLEHVSFGFEYP
ncbi:MAG TPA: hypothetical protein VK179_14205 [Bacteroidales bacterium]|nr:hypothetical protein [Bacteroidales bacterium]